MKSLGQISVYPTPDPKIARLPELARNLWWSWNPAAQSLYEEIDPELWKSVNHNPVKFLRLVSQRRLDAAAADASYLGRYRVIMEAFDRYMNPRPGETWYSRHHADGDGRLIAYFSAEFGLHESLPIYSGGLGILAGDHCKTASDLGLPFVGVGFLYPQGYFQQQIDGEGQQQACYEKLDFTDAAATPALRPDGEQAVISVSLPGRMVHAKVWRVQVGRVPIYLMDTDVEQNAPEDRELSARLYGGDHEVRISQEFVLGIGGVRALRALGLAPTVWHMNEGHAAFLQLERLRELHEAGLTEAQSMWSVRANAVFTTHTPVPAGNDAFSFELMDRFFADYLGRKGFDRDRFLDLGRFEYPWGEQFSMTVLALHTAGRSNGVSRLHGEVSRHMWRSLWPEAPTPEVPIQHITNGVHTDTWVHPGLATLFDSYLGAGWRMAIDERATWQAVAEIPDADLWAQHNRAKAEMLDLVRERVVKQLLRIGAPPTEVNAGERVLDPDALTIGFARRFATYKRATLLFSDPDRLQAILRNPARPVQLIFAGKAHPADEPGKALIQAIYRMSHQPEYAGKIVFVEDYDANIARHLVSGVDLWLNNPRRPLEASGTSGQKAGLNGVPNLSVLDGWWSEGYDGTNGWAIGAERLYASETAQDQADVLSLYTQLEDEIAPMFYERDADGIPRRWLQVMRASIATVAPDYSLDRMLKDYVTQLYVPADRLGASLDANRHAGAIALAAWEERIRAAWPEVGLSATGPARGEMTVSAPLVVRAALRPGVLQPDDLAVELVYGHEQDGDLRDATALPMQREGERDGEHHYAAELRTTESGTFIYGVRVRPHHRDLTDPLALRLVRWA